MKKGRRPEMVPARLEGFKKLHLIQRMLEWNIKFRHSGTSWKTQVQGR